MQNHTRDQAGRFTGSIGRGKDAAPATNSRPRVPLAPVEASEPHHALTDLYERFTAAHGRPPVIGLDLDGTTADLVNTLRARVAQEWGIPAHRAEDVLPDPDQYLMWEGEKAWFNDPAHFTEVFSLSEKEGIYRELDTYHGAPDVLQTLAEHGFIIRAVTARPESYNEDTRYWLEKNGIPVIEILNPGTAKHEVPDIDVFIEDSPKIVERLAQEGRPVLVYDQLYNARISEADKVRRLSAWELAHVVDALRTVLPTPGKAE